MYKTIKDIPIIFDDHFPETFINNVIGWGIPEYELHSKLPDGSYKLLSLDLDFGIKCSLKCPHCFQNNQNTYDYKNLLSWEETYNFIEQASSLGLKYVKILGAGEPFENPDILKLLVELDKRGIHTSIFTKGHVLGSDELTQKYFGRQGINSAKELIEFLYTLKTSILLGFNSFKNDIQLDFVGMTSRNRIKNYIELRDNALLLLTETGFNNFVPNIPTRLALVAAPFKPENIDEIFDIYTWGYRRNIYVATCPTTSSGKGNTELLKQSQHDFDTYMQQVKQLYIDIYSWALKVGVVKKDYFIKHGVSLYPGAHPCNQVACGFYLRLDGSAYYCPGNDSIDFRVSQNIRNEDVKDIWANSMNYRLAEQNKFNFECDARKGSFFKDYPDFYNEVYHKVLSK